MDELQQELFKLQDLKYRNFHSKLMPGIDKETIIGIRTPVLRKFAKEFAKTEAAEAFLQELPHTYYEENNLHMQTILDKGIMPSEKVLDFPVDCNTLTGSVNL